ncbi:O-fucosyltransferase 38 [Bienertia sinuspersici]
MMRNARVSSKKSSLLSLTLYTILLFGVSIFIFLLYSKDFLEDEQNPLLSIDLQSSSSSNLHHQSEQMTSPETVNFVDEKLWTSTLSGGLRPCVKPTAKYKAAQESNRYMTVKCNGGLNQMRTGIADMVAVARIMNATLVIPNLDKRSFWQDSSVFGDIFDELHFMRGLRQDVRIVKELPRELESVPRARKHFGSWSGMSYYENMTHLWREYQVIHVAKSDSRLANNDLPLDIQRLRCRVLYDALRFSPPIEVLGKRLVERLRLRGDLYIALHLRYEKDMLAFTGCTYGLSDAESEELRILREVGIFIKALGYPQSTTIYIAAGEIYGGAKRLSELTLRFPNVVFKETLATRDELEAFSHHATQTAAIDYIISVESDVFIPSHSGNMARAVEGHRRFLEHRKTITPDRKGLIHVFDKLDSGQLEEGPSLSNVVKRMHKNRSGPPPGIKGRARFRYEESFYQNPFPECICNS